MRDKNAAGQDVPSIGWLEVIHQMIIELSDQEYDNNRRYPTNEEIELSREGRYGAMALEKLRDRLTSND